MVAREISGHINQIGSFPHHEPFQGFLALTCMAVKPLSPFPLLSPSGLSRSLRAGSAPLSPLLCTLWPGSSRAGLFLHFRLQLQRALVRQASPMTILSPQSQPFLSCKAFTSLSPSRTSAPGRYGPYQPHSPQIPVTRVSNTL